MAVAAYDSDLTATNGGELTDASNSANWDESSNAAWDDAGTMVDESNFYIQGAECISAQFTKSGVGTIINIQGTAFTVDTDGAILIWAFWASPSSLATYANGGVRTVVGNSLGDFYAFKASGSDFEPNPFGGWYNYAIDPDTATVDSTVGSPTGTWTHVGTAVNATAQSRGNPNAVDAIRVGRCSLEVTNGDATAYGTFAGMANFDDSSGERYALFQAVAGGYRWQGLMSLGLAGTSVDFRDSNANIVVANTPMVSANFNKIEIRNTSSNIEWNSITVNAYGVNDPVAATNSPGKFEMIDGATLAFNSCVFIDMDTFIFKKGTGACNINNSTFKKTGQITAGGASFDGCTFDEITSASHMIAATPAEAALVTNSTFKSDGTGNGIEISGTAADFTLTDVFFEGYSTTVDANKPVYVNIATGSLTLNISGGSGITANSHVRTAGCTVTVANSVPVTITVLDDSTGSPIASTARVAILNASTKAELDTGSVNASGVYSYSYTGSTPLAIVGWVREFSLTGTDYIAQDFSGTITSTGFSLTLRLTPVT